MDNKRTAGVIYALSAYLLWGFTPLYWRLFSGINALELLANRMFWAFFISIAMVAATGSFGSFRDTLKDRRRMKWIILRTILLSLNWYTYVWSVGNGRVLEASLGYYLNPLVSIFLGLLFLRERLSRLQWLAVGFAAAGVVLKTVLVGRFPLISVILAFSFGFYGLMKKKGTDGSIVGMTVESFILLPLSGFYLFFIESSGSGSFMAGDITMKLLFVTTGLITVVPLIFFAKGTSRIPLTWIGFLQFLAPTMMLLFGIFVYHEAMSIFDLLGFASVWIGIVIFLVSSRSKS